ncbi:MAG: EAL domain-containing protein [Lachnospiraceae bacterium]|nr:EAL domain-containing protein [Lachnospiraceae bacterium]
MILWEYNKDKNIYKITLDRDVSKSDAFLSFLLKLPENTEATVETEEFYKLDSKNRFFYVAFPQENTPIVKNTVYLQSLHTDYIMGSENYEKFYNKTADPFMFSGWEIGSSELESLRNIIRKVFSEGKDNFHFDYEITFRGEEHARRLFARIEEGTDGRNFFSARVTELGDSIVLDKIEYEVERERKKILFSLVDDWVYEYNLTSKRCTTISGDPAQYGIFGEGKQEADFISVKGVNPVDKEKLLACARCDVKPGDSCYAEFRLKRKGKERWISLTTRKLFDTNGKEISTIGKISDIDDKKREEEKLRERATTDSLTKLLNREAFKERVEKRLSEMEDTSHVAMVVIDIDNFKSINDRYGHLYGDTAIVIMAETLTEAARKDGLVGRFGGDEFTFFIPNFTTEEALFKYVDNVRNKFTKACNPEGKEVDITCSAGISIFGKDGNSLAEVFVNADSALYYVKEHGKNFQAFCTDEMKSMFTEDKRAEHAEKPIRENSHVSEEIAEFALELLESTDNVEGAIQMLLSKVGKRFSLGALTIYEKSDEGGYALTYAWHDESKIQHFSRRVDFTQKERRQLARILSGREIYEYYEDEDGKHEPPKIYEENGIKALVQFPIMENGEVFGFFTCMDSLAGRHFTEEEKQSLSVTSKILGNYIARDHAYKKIELKVEMMKSHDEVTGLLKYDKFKEVAQNVFDTGVDLIKYAIVSADISHFKYYNEYYGFKAGDEMLADFASIMVTHNSRAVAGCRDFADNFIILLCVNSADAAVSNIENYVASFVSLETDKYEEANLEIVCGVYMVDENGEEIMKAIDNANIAKKALKEVATDGVKIFQPSMKMNRMKEVALAKMIEDAMAGMEFIAYFQPKFNLETGEVSGAEALARWEKQKGFICTPEEFIPILERNGKIVEFDFYMYELVLKQMKTWLNKHLKVLPVSINMSRHHIKNPSFVTNLADMAREYGVPLNLVEIEITESAFIEDQEALVRVMNEIKREGFMVSIDDFGKGYSSLSMLTEVAADIVKLDKDFLKDSNLALSRNMIDNVIHLIKGNNMMVVCKGIETKDQADFLKDIGCDCGQGFYFSKPVSLEEYEKKYLQM